MPIRVHHLLVTLVFGLGALGAFLLFWVLLWLAFGVIRLPRPGDESAANVLSALAAIAWFFYSHYAGGRLAVHLFQRRVLARCPSCGGRTAGLVFLTWKAGEYRCRACGHVQGPSGG